MIETLFLLGGAVIVTLPSLISHKKEAGRQALRSVVYVQGALGFVLAVTTAVLIGLGLADVEKAAKALGVLVWGSRFFSMVAVFCVGIIVGLNLLIRLSCLKASAETRERSEKIFFSLFELQTAIGFFCLILSVWILICEIVINPLIQA